MVNGLVSEIIHRSSPPVFPASNMVCGNQSLEDVVLGDFRQRQRGDGGFHGLIWIGGMWCLVFQTIFWDPLASLKQLIFSRYLQLTWAHVALPWPCRATPHQWCWTGLQGFAECNASWSVLPWWYGMAHKVSQGSQSQLLSQECASKTFAEMNALWKVASMTLQDGVQPKMCAFHSVWCRERAVDLTPCLAAFIDIWRKMDVSENELSNYICPPEPMTISMGTLWL